MHKIFWLLLASLAVVAVSMALRNRRHRVRQATLRATMDAADRLEHEIRAARGALQSAGLGTAGAESALDDALRDLLKQRLWLQSNSATASTEALERVLAGLRDAAGRLHDFSAR